MGDFTAAMVRVRRRRGARASPACSPSNQIPTEENGFTGQNVYRWSDPEADRLMRLSDRQIDDASGRDALGEVQDIVADQVPLIPLYRSRTPSRTPSPLRRAGEPHPGRGVLEQRRVVAGSADPTRPVSGAMRALAAYAGRRLAIAVPLLAAVSASSPTCCSTARPTRWRGCGRSPPCGRRPAPADPAAGPRRALVRGLLEVADGLRPRRLGRQHHQPGRGRDRADPRRRSPRRSS